MEQDTLVEQWVTIDEFPNYRVSNFGRIYNIRRDQIMKISVNNFGHTKISLTSEWGDGERYTRSVARLVADAFVDRPNLFCDQVIVLDGNFQNIVSDNLAWRPEWFAWKYTRQFKLPQPRHYQNLTVMNITTGVVYDSIVQAGITEGLLFADIWMSTYTGKPTFPYGSVFEIV